MPLGTEKEPCPQCCFREIIVAQFIVIQKQILGFNKSRVWQHKKTNLQFHIIPTSARCMHTFSQLGKQLPKASIPEQHSFLRCAWTHSSWWLHHLLPDTTITSLHREYVPTVPRTCVAAGFKLDKKHKVSFKGPSSESGVTCAWVHPGWLWLLAWAGCGEDSFIVVALCYDRAPLSTLLFFNLLWHLGLSYAGDLIQIIWECEFREE